MREPVKLCDAIFTEVIFWKDLTNLQRSNLNRLELMRPYAA